MVAPFTPLTLPQFSAKFVEALQARHPQLPVEIISDSELRIPSGDSHNTIFLDNAYKTYLQDPEAEQDIIHRFLASVVMTGEDRPLDRERIVPVIKDVAWIQEIQASMAARGNDKAIPFVSEPFNDSLGDCVCPGQPGEPGVRHPRCPGQGSPATQGPAGPRVRQPQAVDAQL